MKFHGHHHLNNKCDERTNSSLSIRLWNKRLYKAPDNIPFSVKNTPEPTPSPTNSSTPNPTASPTPNPTASPTPNPTPTPTSTSNFGSSGYQWMTINSVTSSAASGVGQNGITISIVQTGGGMGSINGMYAAGVFPAEYGVPSGGTQIQNTRSGTFTATFGQPVRDALVAFASVGNPSVSVPVQVSTPFTPIWGIDTTYQNPVNASQYSQFTGREGFNIIRIDGTFTSVSFNYAVSEFYCTVCFGFVNQNVPV